MKVLIALASSCGQISGVQRHAINLARCLLTREEIGEVHLAFAPWQQEFVQDALSSNDPRLTLHPVHVGKSALSRNLWFYAELPRIAARLQTDVLHLAYPVPVWRRALHCSTVVTLHDLYPYDIPENFGLPKVLFNRAVLRQCLHSVDAVACVSQSTLSRLRNLDPQLASRKAALIYNSVEAQPASLAETPDPAWGGRPFLLCVAQHRRNKNILLALRVFQQLLQTGTLAPETRMLVVGIQGPETAAIHRFLTDSGLGGRVMLLSGISDRCLQWCYRNCEVLLAPSTIEGFGLPIAEALLAGCRVVCSDIAAFRELGEHCRFVALGADEEQRFAAAVSGAMRSAPAAATALPKLSASAVAEKYLRLYRSLLPPHKSNQRSLGVLHPAGDETRRL